MDWSQFCPNPITVPRWNSPEDFCRFLCGLLVPGSPEEVFWNSVLKRNLKASNFAKQVAPKGLWCARGLRNFKDPIRTKEDVHKIITRSIVEEEKAWGVSYSLNVTTATVLFTVGHYIESDLRGTVKLRKARNILGARREGMLIVSKVLPKNITAWGGDSESGLFNEAEIHVGPCEPKCVQSVFLCSNAKPSFKKATKAERTSYALDEHIEVRWKELPGAHWRDLLSNPGLAILSPSCTVCKGPTVTSIKKVWHTPKGYDWYQVL